MGSTVEVIVSGADQLSSSAIRHARDRIAELEQLWSRFLPESEISRLNRSSGKKTPISAETSRLISLMHQGAIATAGAFDPTMIVPIVRLGYSTSLDGSGATTCLDTDLDHRGVIGAVELGRDGSAQWAMLPTGTALDPGGIGKGLAADIVVEEIETLFGRGSLVSIGGDVSVGGDGPEGRGWRVVVLDPMRQGPIAEVRLARGGVATSSTKLRRFTEPGSLVTRHHLLDPATLAPLASGTAGATVIAGSAAWAEILTKQLMIGGRPALSRLNDRHIGALIVDTEGITTNTIWKEYEEK
jgi:thiamine biosynthesis lipoprotein